MEARYLFKAKRLDNGEWVEGYLIYSKKDCYICEKPYECMDEYSSLNGQSYGFGGFKLVDPHTICQCTGLKDKNGNLIWENDIVRDEHGNFYKEIWQNNYYQFSWICVKSDVFPIGAKWDLWSIKSFEIEVVGNIFDNQELLESEG